jgi:AcrR family transcriptional regulator
MSSTTPGLVWTRPSRSSRSTLDRETVVAAAIRILDVEGLEGLSMRRLGSELNASAASLYWYVANKDELLDIVFDEVMRGLPDLTVEASGVWRSDITAAMDALREMMLRHRWFPLLFPTRPSIGPNALRFWAGVIDVLSRAGLRGAALDNAFCMVPDYVIGTTAIEVTFDRWLAADPDGVAATRAYVREAAAPFPSYVRYVDDYVAKTDSAVRRDRRYEFALECMLDGLAARLPKSRRRRSS